MAPRFHDGDVTEVTVDLGNTARLVCSVDNLGANQISWEKGSQILSVGENLIDKARARTILETTPSSSTLTLTLVSPEDIGVYTCRVLEAEGPGLARDYIVETGAPALVAIIGRPASGELSLAAGEPLDLRCEGRGDPVPRVGWRKEHAMLVPSALQGAALHIPSLQAGDAGIYVCEGSNGFGAAARDSVRVHVRHKPILTLSESVRRHQGTGGIEALVLTCAARAHPRATLEWRWGDGRLETDRSNILRERDSIQLEIRNPTQADLGVYTCTASNSEGTISNVLTNLNTSLLPPGPAPEEELDPKDTVVSSAEGRHGPAVQGAGGRHRPAAVLLLGTLLLASL